MHPDITAYHVAQTATDRAICNALSALIEKHLKQAESKVWHRHPVWFIEGNPIVGYSRIKAGLRMMFWSGADFGEEDLKPGTGKFKDASITYTDVGQIRESDVKRWLKKSQEIQWDYKNIYKTKGRLERLR